MLLDEMENDLGALNHEGGQLIKIDADDAPLHDGVWEISPDSQSENK